MAVGITEDERNERRQALETQPDEVERGAWENLFVSMERSFYNIVDLSATSVRKLSTIALDETDPRKKFGAGWIGRNAGRLATSAALVAGQESLAPETDPETMDKFAEILGTSLPYMAAAIGGGAVTGAAGVGTAIGAAVTSFASMREAAYRDAINTGATESEANIEGNVVGGIQALLEMAQIGGILKQSKTGGALLKSITLNAKAKAWTQVLKSGGKLAGGVVLNATEEALQEALQGTAAEIVPKLLRSKDIEGGLKGFAERRAHEAGAGFVLGGMFASIGSMANLAASKGKAAHIPGIAEVEGMADPTVDEQAAQEFEAGEPDVLAETSDVPTEEDVDFDPEVAAQEQVADKVVEGGEIEPITESLVEEEVEVQTEEQLAIDKVNSAIEGRDLGEARKLTEVERTQMRAEKTARAEAAKQRAKDLDPDITADELQQIALSELEGEMPKAVFPAFEVDEVSPQEWEQVRWAVEHSNLRTYEKIRATQSLNMLQDGIIPQPANLDLLATIMGREQINKIKAAGRRTGKLAGIALELINFPVTTLASFDISMVGRQGITTVVRYPKLWSKAVVASYRAALSPEYAQQAMNDMDTDAWAEQRRRSGVARTELDGDLSSTEQQFFSTWAKRIPILKIFTKASERAAVVGMNKLRASIFNQTATEWVGSQRTEANFKELADVVNASTGRGNFKKGGQMETLLPYLNAAFFSPRYVASRFELMGKGGKAIVDVATGRATPAGKVLAAEMVTFVSAGMTAMVLAKMMGADVEEDPRSSDFGKIKIGKTRVDVWGGFQQIVRAAVQIGTGQGKAVSSGEVFDKNRLETVGRFIQSKLNPAAGMAVELLSGKDFLGEPIKAPESLPEFMGMATKRLAPLVMQDIADAWRFSDSKVMGVASMPLAFHGIGVQTYEPNALDDLTEMRNHYSRRVFGSDWDQLGPASQNALREYKPQIVQQEQVARFERRNASFDMTRQRQAGESVEESLPDDVQDAMTAVNVTLGGLSRTIVRNWRLNAKLYKQYQDDLSGILNKVLPNIIRQDWYSSLAPDMQQGVLDRVIKEAKSAVRKNIVLTANLGDLEDMRKGVEDD